DGGHHIKRHREALEDPDDWLARPKLTTGLDHDPIRAKTLTGDNRPLREHTEQIRIAKDRDLGVADHRERDLSERRVREHLDLPSREKTIGLARGARKARPRDPVEDSHVV